VISGFSSDAEGGSVLNDGELMAYRVVFVGNAAGTTGGAVHNRNVASFWSCMFELNAATTAGANLYNDKTMYFNPCSSAVDVSGTTATCMDADIDDPTSSSTTEGEDTDSSSDRSSDGKPDDPAEKHGASGDDSTGTSNGPHLEAAARAVSFPHRPDTIVVTSYEDSTTGSCRGRLGHVQPPRRAGPGQHEALLRHHLPPPHAASPTRLRRAHRAGGCGRGDHQRGGPSSPPSRWWARTSAS
jgi:hypothetical protein